MTDDLSRREGRLAWRVAWAALAVAVALGTLLRWFFAGVALPFGEFANLRSAHSHLGYYGVVFPFVWAAWARMGLPVPGHRLVLGYAVAVAASIVDFAAEGYAPVSIAGSTVVLATWIAVAWRHRSRLLQPDWLAPVFPAVALSAMVIPAVAVLSRRGDPRAPLLVHTFLGWLLLGVAVPTAFRSAGVRAPRGPFHAVAVVGSGLALGVFPNPVTRLLLACEAVLLLRSAASVHGDRMLAVLWAALAAGLLGVASGLVPDLPGVAVAGLHLALLGPVLVSLAWRERGVARTAYGVLVLASCAAIALQPWAGLPSWPRITAVLGTSVALAWCARLASAFR